MHLLAAAILGGAVVVLGIVMITSGPQMRRRGQAMSPRWMTKNQSGSETANREQDQITKFGGYATVILGVALFVVILR